jgi:hypothetical protein
MERQPRKFPADNLEAAQFKIYRVLMRLRRIRSLELPRNILERFPYRN